MLRFITELSPSPFTTTWAIEYSEQHQYHQLEAPAVVSDLTAACPKPVPDVKIEQGP